MSRGLTVKQQRFVLALLGPARGNRRLACKLAGYEGSSNVLAVQGHRNMNNSKILELLRKQVEPMAERIVGTYEAALSATKQKAVLYKGEFHYSNPEPYYAIRMEAADRLRDLLECCLHFQDQRSQADEMTAKDAEDVELQKEIAELDPRERESVRQLRKLDESLAVVKNELAEDTDGHGQEDES